MIFLKRMLYPTIINKIFGCSMRFLYLLALILAGDSYCSIKSTHIYHNHMPNFWPFFDLSRYESLEDGEPIRYFYAADVIQAKKSPKSAWPRLPDSRPMPHDNLSEGGYYPHHAKWGAYQYWPQSSVEREAERFPFSQKHVTMSGAVINSVNSLNLNDIPELGSKYSNPNWGARWRDTHYKQRTVHNFPKLDLLNFTAHHSMGPLVGNDYFEKELISQRVSYKKSYFLGENAQISNGFFPTELGFSPRLIPSLSKLNIKWAAVANVHLSRTLLDYPYLNDPGIDTLSSPPNRADLRNSSDIGAWKSLQMFNEKQVTHNKFPFAATPRRSFYVDPQSAEISNVVAIPVEQASSWEEGYQGQVRAKALYDVSCESSKPCYFVIAHDGDNSSGRAGSEETWNNSSDITYADPRVEALGVDEYLMRYPVKEEDYIHIQDGSWIDTRDSSADPSWYHWHLPFGVWEGQRQAFNEIYKSKLENKRDWYGTCPVSGESGKRLSLS